MGRKHKKKKKSPQSLQLIKRRKRALLKPSRVLPRQSSTDRRRKPKLLKSPEIQIHGGLPLCVDCETPRHVKDFCDGSMAVIRETCRYHRLLPDPMLTTASNHPEQPIFYPKKDPICEYHTGRCIIAADYYIVGSVSIFKSIYFRRCNGLYANALGEEIAGSLKFTQVRIGSEAIPWRYSTGEIPLPSPRPFKVRFCLDMLKQWNNDQKELERRVRKAFKSYPLWRFKRPSLRF